MLQSGDLRKRTSDLVSDMPPLRLQVEAEKLLMRQALSDPLNQRFVLLSETCVPLYPAPLVWAQLQGETRSRVNACSNSSNPDDENWRMTYRCPFPSSGWSEHLLFVSHNAKSRWHV